MIPVLFSPKTREYNNNGLGVLVDVGYCTVTEERNGSFELELQYPVNGSHYADLGVDCQILAKPNETSDPQAFRIYKISKPMNGVVTVRAEHISYELSSVIVKPFSATSAPDALSKIKSNSIGENNFDFWTDKSTTANMSQTKLLSARSLLGGVAGSVLDVYTGEYEFDNYTVKLHQNRGTDNGVVIAYAKNLTGVKCEERSDGIVTGAIAYWAKEVDGIVQSVYGDLQTIETELSYSRNVVVDCSSEFEDAPSKSSLNEYATKYIQEHKNVPYFSVSVEFVNLGDTEEYKQYKGLYRVNLCDTVTVRHPLYGIDVKAKVVKTVFDSVNEKYEKIQIGEISSNISRTIAAQEKEIAEKVTYSALDKAIANATNAITGNKGGYVVIRKDEETGIQSELLIMDEPNISTATKVWRWNTGGLGYSSNGYNGDYATAITADGKIVADFITTGTLDASNLIVKNISADSIVSGVLMSKSGLSSFSLEDGVAEFGTGLFKTRIEQGGIQQYAYDSYIGGLVPISKGKTLAESLFYKVAHAGVAISMMDDNGDVFNAALFKRATPTCAEFCSGILTNTMNDSTSAAIRHQRTAVYGEQTISTEVSFGCSSMNGQPNVYLQCGAGAWTDALARIDMQRSSGEAYVTIFASSGGVISPKLEIGEKIWWSGDFHCYKNISSAGNVTCTNVNANGTVTADEYKPVGSVLNLNGESVCIGTTGLGASGFKVYMHENVLVGGNLHANGVITNSDRKIKKNIKTSSFKNAEKVVKNLKIYDYDLKETGSSVKMGLMADEAPDEILAENKKGINLYSYCGLLAMAIQEMSEKIEKLEKGGKDYVGNAEQKT